MGFAQVAKDTLKTGNFFRLKDPGQHADIVIAGDPRIEHRIYNGEAFVIVGSRYPKARQMFCVNAWLVEEARMVVLEGPAGLAHAIAEEDGVDGVSVIRIKRKGAGNKTRYDAVLLSSLDEQEQERVRLAQRYDLSEHWGEETSAEIDAAEEKARAERDANAANDEIPF